MKALFTIIISTLMLTTASASNFEGIKIGTSGKSAIVAKYSSNKATVAVISITNQAGMVINTQNVIISKGNNSIALIDIATLPEGTFTISIVANGKTATADFVNFKMD